MRICLYDTNHWEVAYQVKLFDLPTNELVIFTTERLQPLIAWLLPEREKYQWVILKGGRLAFFQQLYRELKARKPDLIFINTISSNHLLYALMLELLGRPRVILTVHNINCLFATRPSFNLPEMVRHIGKKRLIRAVGEFNVIATTMLPYMRRTAPSSKTIHCIPALVFEQPAGLLTIDTFLHLVVPGTLDKRRRDYEVVFELLRLAEERQLPLHLTLAGGYYDEEGKALYRRAAALKTVHTRLTAFDTYQIPQEEFLPLIAQAHFIFIPSVIDTAICGAIPEVYGITKSSGNIDDVARYAKPYISPATLEVPETLRSNGFRYQSLEEVVQFLEGLNRSKADYQNWQQSSITNSQAFTLPAIRQGHPALFS